MSKINVQQLKQGINLTYDDVKYELFAIFGNQRVNGKTFGQIYTDMTQELDDLYTDKSDDDYKINRFALIMHFGKALLDYEQIVHAIIDNKFICEFEDVMKRIEEDSKKLFDLD